MDSAASTLVTCDSCGLHANVYVYRVEIRAGEIRQHSLGHVDYRCKMSQNTSAGFMGMSKSYSD